MDGKKESKAASLKDKLPKAEVVDAKTLAESLSYSRYIDSMREYWREHSFPIPPAQYAEGWPKPVATKEDGTPIFVWMPWPKGSDMPTFARVAAAAMAGACEHPFPYDVCDFAHYLRRSHVLTKLGFPIDQKGLAIICHIENAIPEDERTAPEILARTLDFLAGLEKVQDGMRTADKADMEMLKRLMAEGKATYLDPKGGGAVRLDYKTDFWGGK